MKKTNTTGTTSTGQDNVPNAASGEKREKIEEQVKGWEAGLEKFRSELASKLEATALGSKVEEFAEKLNELRHDGGDRFDMLRAGVESAWAELRAGFEMATAPNEPAATAPNEPATTTKASDTSSSTSSDKDSEKDTWSATRATEGEGDDAKTKRKTRAA